MVYICLPSNSSDNCSCNTDSSTNAIRQTLQKFTTLVRFFLTHSQHFHSESITIDIKQTHTQSANNSDSCVVNVQVQQNDQNMELCFVRGLQALLWQMCKWRNTKFANLRM